MVIRWVYWYYLQAIGKCDSCKQWPPKGSGTIRRCVFVEVGVPILEEVCQCGSGL